MEKVPSGNSLELEVSDFGPIAEAKIELRSLTVSIQQLWLEISGSSTTLSEYTILEYVSSKDNKPGN